LADWTHDFSEVETPLLIKYVKIEQWGKQSEQKKIAKKDENVFYCPFYQRKKSSLSLLSINFDLLPKYVCSRHVLVTFI
jgi:hypothetical protein